MNNNAYFQQIWKPQPPRLYLLWLWWWFTALPHFLAHLRRRLIWWAYRIGRPLSYIVVHTLLTSSSQKPLGQSKSNFIWSFYGMEERNYAQMFLVTWPRWPPCPYMVKTLKNHLLWNQKANDLETWHATLGAQVLPSLLKWWPWADLDLFYGKVKFGSLCFCMGKR